MDVAKLLLCGTLLSHEQIKMSLFWTPSMFQKLFQLVAKSDTGVLGAMGNRDRVVSLGEFIGFMKANSYKALGLNLTDLTDAFKFSNNATGGGSGLIESEDSAQQLQRGAALLCSLHWTWLNA